MLRGGEGEEELMCQREALLYSTETAVREKVSQVVVLRSHTNRSQGDLLQETESKDLAEQCLS